MKNRFIPFGYQVKNGEIVIVPSEAEMRKSFRKSMRIICQECHSNKSPYC